MKLLPKLAICILACCTMAFSFLYAQSIPAKGCVDTSGRFTWKKDHLYFYSGDVIATADNNILVAGRCLKTDEENHGVGFLVKCNKDGGIIWSKLYDSTTHKVPDFLEFDRALLLKDGSVVLAGFSFNSASNASEVLVMHLDAAGNVLWSKQFRNTTLITKPVPNGSVFVLQQVQQDAYSGDIFITGSHWYAGRSVTRISLADGAMVWSKLYAASYKANFDQSFGMDIGASEIRSFGRLVAFNQPYLGIYRINKATGDTLQTRFLKVTNADANKAGYSTASSMVVLNNGHYVVNGVLYGWGNIDNTGAFYHMGYTELDNNLNFVQGYGVKSRYSSNYLFSRLTFYPDKTGMLNLQCRNEGDDEYVYYVQLQDTMMMKRRKRSMVDEGSPSAMPAIRLSDGSDLMIKILNNGSPEGSYIEGVKINATDVYDVCMGGKETELYWQPIVYAPASWTMDAVTDGALVPGALKTITPVTVSLTEAQWCRRINVCDTLHLEADNTSLCSGDSLLLTAHKNSSCGAEVVLQYDTSWVQSLHRINDSVYQVHFKKEGEGYLHAITGGCTVLSDSVLITVMQSLQPPSLGKDTVLCAGTTIALHVAVEDATYQWQDGSTAAIYEVTEPGSYSVTVTGTCGAVKSNTIQVKPYKVPLALGGPITACKQDTVDITAPDGFISYQWTPDYDVIANEGKVLQVKALADTLYYLKAEQFPGCFGYDSVQLLIKDLPEGFLPADTSVCSYGTLLITPEGKYTAYLWSTHSTTDAITVSQPGVYWLTVKDTYNCSGSDTVWIGTKECLEGFYMPTAFTPDADGKNDVLRPLLFGDIQQYEFTVYNRWGQQVYSSKTPMAGWDGRFKGSQQNGNTVYIWYCRFQLRGHEVVVKKGTVLLLR